MTGNAAALRRRKRQVSPIVPVSHLPSVQPLLEAPPLPQRCHRHLEGCHRYRSEHRAAQVPEKGRSLAPVPKDCRSPVRRDGMQLRTLQPSLQILAIRETTRLPTQSVCVLGIVRLYPSEATVKSLQARTCRYAERGLADGRLKRAVFFVGGKKPFIRYWDPVATAR